MSTHIPDTIKKIIIEYMGYNIYTLFMISNKTAKPIRCDDVNTFRWYDQLFLCNRNKCWIYIFFMKLCRTNSVNLLKEIYPKHESELNDYVLRGLKSACARGNSDIIEYLFEYHGKNITKYLPGWSSNSLLSSACESGSVEIVDTLINLLDKSDIKYNNMNVPIATLMKFAVKNSNIDLLKYLTNWYYTSYVTNDYQHGIEDCIISAIMKSRDPKMLNYLSDVLCKVFYVPINQKIDSFSYMKFPDDKSIANMSDADIKLKVINPINWYTDRFIKSDDRKILSMIFSKCINYHRYYLAKYLQKRFKITLTNIENCWNVYSYIMRVIDFGKGDIEFIDWFFKTFSIVNSKYLPGIKSEIDYYDQIYLIPNREIIKWINTLK